VAGLEASESYPLRKGLVFIKLAKQGSTVLAGAALRDAIGKFGRENVYFVQKFPLTKYRLCFIRHGLARV
jgi:hypothetical protein